MSSLALDPHHALALIRRRVARAPVQAAEGLARLVRDTPSHRLDQLMRTPVRRVVLDGIFWQMPQQLDRRRSAGMRASILWQITGRSDGETDSYQLEFGDGRCRVIRGRGGSEPRVTITVDGAEFLRIATGNSDPMRAYFNGRLALAGDILVAAKLASLFRAPGGVDVSSRT
jgi:putative sterol carrier protein